MIKSILSSTQRMFKDFNLLEALDYASFFRIAISFLAITAILSYGNEYYALFAGESIPTELTYQITNNKEKLAFGIFEILSADIDQITLFSWIRTIYVISLVLLLVGFLTRVFASIA